MGIINVEGIMHAETSKLVTLFGSLPVIEFLLLEYRTIRYMSAGGVPKRLPTTLNNLKTLKLFICFEEVNEISVILCLIRSSPNLEKITIMVRRSETADVIDHVLQLLEMQDWSDVSLNQLQVVELSNLSGTESELKYIELLLAISAVLETINREGC
ncbi:F-box/FBD/LRR-repeat protein At1g13570-like [Camellia sinensis]|uniref:F-box/FBD/LRR-repeat protein At1g13570-like n=1 Tax=Camellia sinensis TaxID=4442 RepID=UPI0010368653|nr:F-box/FBD/LRR-repeat protein At1g13570-like [Camellia sinensis]XP_028076656.1 F-box/FBD/LRR-repeat protein At1g13570-like [Camellia sinensis]XP_028076663.1 F-box/FBD/LRR-repeat protein At1g13570-like [Camellia sinensis]XP_028076671.1 F-box/FBD/LRR-repeat protein At1g13570-like [Camellia sinensis]XP_028076681.1 F-box/FBD/LRR-repeat protein At1g13570-like [Camellia sinensis]XP_028076687.1 F-box/FBD/LRR-repeat protein At1g13570-like [Camellia sinensis]XP_028076693.1 F-box/FBD/LRR-repeat prote